jgi:hypothetical protein
MTVMEEETYPVECLRDVAKHHCGADVAAIENALPANTVVRIVGVVLETMTELGGRSMVCWRSVGAGKESTLIVDGRKVLGGAEQTLALPAFDVLGSPKESLL